MFRLKLLGIWGLCLALVLPLLAGCHEGDSDTAEVLDIIETVFFIVTDNALSYDKLVKLYLARIEAYDKQGPALNTVITLNPKAL